MSKIWLIIQREYITRVKKRSFILTTLLAPAGFALLMIAMIFIVDQGESKKRIIVKDESGYFNENRFKDSVLYFNLSDSSREYLSENYKKLNYDIVLFIPEMDIDKPKTIQYLSDKQLSFKTEEYIARQIEKVFRDKKIERANINKKDLAKIDNTKVHVERGGVDGENKGNSAIATAIGYTMGFVIYMVLFIYGAMVMKGVAEEKTNRIMEVLASSVRPFQLMMGKIIGIGAVGLTQFILWFLLSAIIFFIIGIVFGPQIMELQHMAANPSLAQTPDQEQAAAALAALSQQPILMYLGFFLFYFLGGYLIYGALYAALGSAVNDDGDAQSLTVFVSIPIILSIGIMMSAIQEPDSNLAIWGSIIPFTAPIVMPARLPFILETSSWQIPVSMISVIIGFIFTTWISAKIYRTGILMYGKKVTVKEILKWVVQSDAF